MAEVLLTDPSSPTPGFDKAVGAGKAFLADEHNRPRFAYERIGPQPNLVKRLRRRGAFQRLRGVQIELSIPTVAAPAERPRERRPSTRRTSRGSPSGDPDPSHRPPLTAAERHWLKNEVSRLRLEQIERDRVAPRELFAEAV